MKRSLKSMHLMCAIFLVVCATRVVAQCPCEDEFNDLQDSIITVSNENVLIKESQEASIAYGTQIKNCLNDSIVPDLMDILDTLTSTGGGDCIEVSGQTTISQPGMYCLVETVSVSGATAITIASSDVVLDLNGHVIVGNQTAGSGITINSSLQNVTIKNGFIKDEGVGITSSGSVNKLTIEDVCIDSCGGSGISIGGSSNRNVVIRSSAISRSRIIGQNTDPVLLVQNCSNGALVDLKVSDNGDDTLLQVISLDTCSCMKIDTVEANNNSLIEPVSAPVTLLTAGVVFNVDSCQGCVFTNCRACQYSQTYRPITGFDLVNTVGNQFINCAVQDFDGFGQYVGFSLDADSEDNIFNHCLVQDLRIISQGNPAIYVADFCAGFAPAGDNNVFLDCSALCLNHGGTNQNNAVQGFCSGFILDSVTGDTTSCDNNLFVRCIAQTIVGGFQIASAGFQASDGDYNEFKLCQAFGCASLAGTGDNFSFGFSDGTAPSSTNIYFRNIAANNGGDIDNQFDPFGTFFSDWVVKRDSGDPLPTLTAGAFHNLAFLG